ncbi:MAG: MoaD/ThiS family protein [Acidimicrobiales bacterium]
MAVLRLFAGARLAAGTSTVAIDASSVDELLDLAVARFGEEFAKVLADSGVWVNGEPAAAARALSASDEVAVLPPVSGGS